MPFGDHWEWRGFGQTTATFRAWFHTLPSYLPTTDNELHDTYLWTPTCRHNVKLRYNALKFKRFLAREGMFERWLEAPDEVLPFPMAPEHLRQVEILLDVRLPELPTHPVDRDAFLALLARAHPPVHQVLVMKQRRLSRWRLPSGDEVLVEWTRLRQPRVQETVSLEHERLAVLARAYEGLASRLSGLQPMNYLQAIAHWLSPQEN